MAEEKDDNNNSKLKVVSFNDRKDALIKEQEKLNLPVDEDVVELLQIFLDQAKEGLIVEMAYIMRYCDDSAESAFVGATESPDAMLGRITMLRRDYEDWIKELQSFEDDDEDTE